MKNCYVLAAAVAATAPTVAHATTIYPGCATPSLKASHHTFYIDPVNGSQKGDGSAAKPWHTLAEVLNTNNKLLSTTGHNSRTFSSGDTTLTAVNPTAPIKPGDVIMLKTGDHGAVRLTNSYNTDFITVMPAPGAAPLIDSLAIVSSGKWLFQGLKFLGATPVVGGVTSLVSVGRGDFIGSTSNVIVDSSAMSATDDTSQWTPDDWNSKPNSYQAYLNPTASCVALTNNNVYNAINGIGVGSSKTLVQGNTITKMFNDGIDFFGSDETIKSNTIKDGVNVFASETLHPDGIQGWSLTTNGVVNTNTNDVIDSNTVIKTGSGNVTQMQGISVFDGSWDGLQIVNNFVVSNIYHGIAIYGGKNVSIINNTVVGSDPAFGTWIIAHKSKANVAGTNIVVRNNIASNVVIDYPGPSYDHNLAIASIQVRDASNKVSISKSGVVGNNNRVIPTLANGFMEDSPSTSLFDVRLRPTSAAIAAGSSVSAPAYDIQSKRRANPVDVGAYVH